MSKQENLVNLTALHATLSELDTITSAPDGGKSRELRVKALLARAAALKSGFGVDELNRAQLLGAIPDDDPTLTGRSDGARRQIASDFARRDRKSTRLNSSHGYISYAVFCLKKKTMKMLH